MTIRKNSLHTVFDTIKGMIKALFAMALVLVIATTFCVNTARAQEISVKSETAPEVFGSITGTLLSGQSRPLLQEFVGSLSGTFTNIMPSVNASVTINRSGGTGTCNGITVNLPTGNTAPQPFSCNTAGGLVTVRNAGPATVLYSISFGF